MPTNKLPPSKWHEIKKQSDATNHHAPVDNAARIKRLFLDTQIGSPIDTVEETDAQRNNLGPKDTKLEAENTNDEPHATSRPR